MPTFTKSTQHLTRMLLSQSNVADIVVQLVPFVRRLQDLDEIRSFRMTYAGFGEKTPFLLFKYDGIATSELYPRVHENLETLGVTNGAKCVYNKPQSIGTPQEHQSLTYMLEEDSIQVCLRVFNPQYRPGQ